MPTDADTQSPPRRTAAALPASAGVRRPLLVGLGTLTAAGLVAMANPESNHVPLCPLKAVTGLDCPFCGSLRAVQDLVHGDLAGAADHNVLFVASLPFLAIAWVSWLVRSSSGDDQRPVAPRWLLPTFLVAATAFAVLRNLPSMTWLASG